MRALTGGNSDIYPRRDVCLSCKGNTTADGETVRSIPYCNCTYPYKEGPSVDCYEATVEASPLK